MLISVSFSSVIYLNINGKVQRELFSPAKYIPRSTVCKVCTIDAFLGFLNGVTRVNSDH